MSTTTQARWATPRAATPAEKTSSLRDALIGVYAVVQASFVAFFVGIHVAAASEMTGEGYNDLGVTLGRELVLHEVYGYWIISTVALALVFGGAYAYGKHRWTS